MDIFRDQIWQFIGVITGLIIGLVSIGASIWMARNPFNKKMLSAQILAMTELIQVNQLDKSRFRIELDGKWVRDPFLLILSIINTGSMPISSKDFERPLDLYLGEEAEIIDVEVIKTSSKSIEPSITRHDNSITIAPLLLNQNEYLTIKLLLANYERKIDFRTRIIGVDEISVVTKLPTVPQPNTLLAVMPLFLTLLFMIVTSITKQYGLLLCFLPLLVTSAFLSLVNYFVRKRRYFESIRLEF